MLALQIHEFLRLSMELPANHYGQLKSTLMFSECAFSKSMCYVTSLAGKIYGVDTRTGNVEWTFATDGYIAHHREYYNDSDYWRDDILGILKTNEEFLVAIDKMGGIYS